MRLITPLFNCFSKPCEPDTYCRKPMPNVCRPTAFCNDRAHTQQHRIPRQPHSR